MHHRPHVTRSMTAGKSPYIAGPWLSVCMDWAGVSKSPPDAGSPQSLWASTLSHNRHSLIRELNFAQVYRFAKVSGNEQKLVRYFPVTQSTHE